MCEINSHNIKHPSTLHILLFIKFSRTIARKRFITSALAIFATFILVNGAYCAEPQDTVAGFLTRSLRAYEAHRPMEAEEWWRQARTLEPRIARPPWLTPGQELPADTIAQSTEVTGYSLWGLFIRLLTLPLLLALLVWQGWKAIHDIRENIEASTKKTSVQTCPECARLSQEYNKLQRKFELLQKSAAGSSEQ